MLLWVSFPVPSERARRARCIEACYTVLLVLAGDFPAEIRRKIVDVVKRSWDDVCWGYIQIGVEFDRQCRVVDLCNLLGDTLNQAFFRGVWLDSDTLASDLDMSDPILIMAKYITLFISVGSAPLLKKRFLSSQTLRTVRDTMKSFTGSSTSAEWVLVDQTLRHVDFPLALVETGSTVTL